MSRVCLQVTVTLLSDTIIASGNSIPGEEDISLRLDAGGRPILPGATLKGLLRESMEDLLVWTHCVDSALPDKLFGTAGIEADDSRRLIFGTLHLTQASDWSVRRTFTKLSEGVAAKGSLRVAECLRRGLSLRGFLLCAEEDSELVQRGLSAIKWLGLLRNRGFGRVRISAEPARKALLDTSIGETDCLRYRLRLETPLTEGYLRGRNSRETRKNFAETRAYVPGSAIRGFVISALAKTAPEWFSAHRAQLLGDDVHFLNAFPILNGKATIPTPGGFYEDKAQTRFYSVLTTQEVVPGDKRAHLDRFCVLQGDILLHGAPAMTSSLRILRKGEKQMFTAQAIAEDTELEGYILLKDPSLAPMLAEVLRGQLWLGADRYAGNGLCSVTELCGDVSPAWLRCSIADAEIPQELYMLLLSPMTMYQNGEPTGLDEAALAKALQVAQVTVESCATSITEIHGFNQTWGCEVPVLPMYEAGSVFRLRCTPAPSASALRALEREGFGVRTNEGYGQVLFLRGYAAITRQARLVPPKKKTNDEAAAMRRARCRWLLEHCDRLPSGLSASQLGNIQALCEQAISRGGDLTALEQYFANKSIAPKQREAFAGMEKLLQSICHTPLYETLGIPLCKDGIPERLTLLVDMIDLARKEGTRR